MTGLREPLERIQGTNFVETYDGLKFECPGCNRLYFLASILDGMTCECDRHLGPVFVQHRAAGTEQPTLNGSLDDEDLGTVVRDHAGALVEERVTREQFLDDLAHVLRQHGYTVFNDSQQEDDDHV